VSGIAGVVMPIDAIDEFSAQTQSNAETGRNSGGTVNLTIKTGTNEVHGSGYYYNRNEFYAASSPFFVPTPDFPKAPELRNQNWGGTVGGPIVKNKVFFFMGFEKQNYIFGLTGLSTEPSNAWVSQAMSLLNSAGVPESPLSARLLSTLYPSSILNLSATIGNYFATVPGTGYSYNGVAKVDINFTDKERLSLHWFGGQGDQTQPPGASLALATASSNLGYYFEVAPIHVQNYSAVLSSVFTNKLTNQLLFGVSYFDQIFHDSNNSFNMANLGLNLSPAALVGGQPVMGASNIEIIPASGGGFDQVGITPPEGRQDITGHVTDTLSYIEGRHELKFGGEYRNGRVDEFYYRRSTGEFTFDGTQGPWAGTCGTAPTPSCADTLALADFLAGDVSTSSIAVGDAERKVLVNAFDFFAQDNWQVTTKLNINYGLRWDYFGPLHSNGVNNLGVFEPGQGLVIQGDGLGSIYKPDYHNFAPRFGFAYSAGQGFVIRGGYGIYFDQINMNPFLDFRPPISAADGLEDNPIGPDAVDSYSRNGYNWTTAQAGGASIFPGVTTCLGNPATDPNCLPGTGIYNVFAVNHNFRPSYNMNYNLNIQKSLGQAAVLEVGYVGSQGRRLSIMQNINQNGAFNAQYPSYGSIIQLNSIGNSNYNSLQTTLRVRAYHGFTSQFSFTWAHALDDVTEYRGQIPLDSFNLRQEYGSSDYDTRLNFTAFMTYDIPGAHRWKLITSGWQASGLISLHSGQPFDFPGTNLSGAQRPGVDITGSAYAGVTHTFIQGVGEEWVNPAAFVAVSGPGNLGRNALYGPGFADVDLSVFKNFAIKERLHLQLRAEMFNVLNRINLASGPGSVGSNGYVSDTIGDFNGAPGLGPGEPFNLQIAGKVIF
jgi:hypothetical protein